RTATPGDAAPYSLEAVALLGTNGTDVFLTVSSATDALPDRLEKVQVKALPFGGDNLRTSNYFELPAPGGAAVLNLPNLARHRQLQFLAHVKAGDQNNVEAATQVLLRPDLAVGNVSAPTDVVRRQQFTVTATVAEIAGDSAASATATRTDDGTQLAAK